MVGYRTRSTVAYCHTDVGMQEMTVPSLRLGNRFGEVNRLLHGHAARLGLRRIQLSGLPVSEEAAT